MGRFPTVTLGFGEDPEEEKEQPKEKDVQTDNACRQWLLKVCPYCFRGPSDDDITDTLVTGIDELDKEDGINDEKPVTGDSELDGNWHLGELAIVLFITRNKSQPCD